jgi:hypothetical protein
MNGKTSRSFPMKYRNPGKIAKRKVQIGVSSPESQFSRKRTGGSEITKPYNERGSRKASNESFGQRASIAA